MALCLLCLLLLNSRLVFVSALPIDHRTDSIVNEIDESSSSGISSSTMMEEPSDYILSLSNDSFQVTVELNLTRCIEYDPDNPIDIKSYIIEVITMDDQPLGTFININPYLDAAELSTGNKIIFQSNYPSVMDFPAKYSWKPNPGDTNQSVCFRATMIKQSTNETLTKCITPNEEIFTSHVVSETPPTNSPEPTPTHSPERIAYCSNKWNCTNAVIRNGICGSDNVTYPSRCAMRYQGCLLDIDITGKKGECPETTEPPTTEAPTTTEPTTIPRGPCTNSPGCSNLGYYKRIQCTKSIISGVRCWCSRLDQDVTISDIINVSCETNPCPIKPNCYST